MGKNRVHSTPITDLEGPPGPSVLEVGVCNCTQLLRIGDSPPRIVSAICAILVLSSRDPANRPAEQETLARSGSGLAEALVRGGSAESSPAWF